MEPVLPNSRNHGFQEHGIHIDMFPYRVLPSLPGFAEKATHTGKRILVDMGTNGFYGSAKSLIDMYAPFAKFDEVHLFEPDAANMEVPQDYIDAYHIEFHQTIVRVGKRDSHDILTFTGTCDTWGLCGAQVWCGRRIDTLVHGMGLFGWFDAFPGSSTGGRVFCGIALLLSVFELAKHAVALDAAGLWRPTTIAPVWCCCSRLAVKQRLVHKCDVSLSLVWKVVGGLRSISMCSYSITSRL